MGAIQRLLEYIDKKKISKYKFYQSAGLSNGFLDKGINIGSDKCEKIIYAFPDLSLEWLITGKGEMLRTPTADLSEDSNSTLFDPDRYLSIIESQQRTIECLAESIHQHIADKKTDKD